MDRILGGPVSARAAARRQAGHGISARQHPDPEPGVESRQQDDHHRRRDDAGEAGQPTIAPPRRARRCGLSRTDASSLRQLAWSSDGRSIAGIVNGKEGSELWTLSADGATANSTRHDKRIASPAWTPGGNWPVSRPSTTTPASPSRAAEHRSAVSPDVDAYGPVAFSPDGQTAYVSLANDAGTVDLWALSTSSRDARRLTNFARDTYAPSVASDGSGAVQGARATGRR